MKIHACDNIFIIFKKSPGLRIDLIHLSVSCRQEENIWSTKKIVNYQFNFKVVWLLVISEGNNCTLTELPIYSFPEDRERI